MNQLLKISEFARLSGFSRKNLIYYDEIGLLPPERVADNGYRYYSHRQLETVSVIDALQEVGMSLREIKRHLDERTPAALTALFTVQRDNVEEKIRRLERIEAMIDTRLGITRRALEVDASQLALHRCTEELLFAGMEIVCEDTEAELEKALLAFYALCDREKITYGYPFGTMVARETLLEGGWHLPSRFFYKMPNKEGTRAQFVRPAGLYLIGFEHCSYDGPHEIYERMFAFMKREGLAVAGNSYEEFLLDEIAVKNPDSYLLQVSIQVAKAR